LGVSIIIDETCAANLQVRFEFPLPAVQAFWIRFVIKLWQPHRVVVEKPAYMRIDSIASYCAQKLCATLAAVLKFFCCGLNALCLKECGVGGGHLVLPCMAGCPRCRGYARAALAIGPFRSVTRMFCGTATHRSDATHPAGRIVGSGINYTEDSRDRV
jgi:hypothetical protein